LLASVAEKNGKEDNTKGDTAKQEKEQPIDYVAKQAVLLGHTKTNAKLSWWVGFIFRNIRALHINIPREEHL